LLPEREAFTWHLPAKMNKNKIQGISKIVPVRLLGTRFTN
jgi:hypothetical protein